VLEIIEGIFKGFGVLLRLFVEGGFIDVSLSLTGRFFIKLFYPPHWLKKITYKPAFERYVGAIIWGLFAYGVYVLDKTL
jgi:hypothetical protein